jgi:platelet-activating factor acetylhydrolase IB subunit alpha
MLTVFVRRSRTIFQQVWDHESGDYIRTLKGHTNTVNGVKFSPSGSHLVSCSTDLSIKLWDVHSYACLRTLRGHDHTISAIAFVPLLTYLLAPGASSSESNTKTGTGVTASVAGSQHVLSASRDSSVKLWDVETGFCEHTFTDHHDWVRCLAVRQSDGALWASSGNDQVIYVYDSATKRKLVELRGHEHVVESIAFITEEPAKHSTSSARSNTKHTETVRDYLASGSRDRTVRLWKISESACLATFKAHENWVRSVLIHPSGLYVLSSSDDKSIRIFDIKSNRCLRTLDGAHNHFITSLDMHHTLPILVSGSVDQTLRCWLLQ